MAALFPGVIEIDDGDCLGLREPSSTTVRTILWPHDTVVGTDAAGRPAVTIGRTTYLVGDQISYGIVRGVPEKDLPAEAAKCASTELRLIDSVK